MTAANYPRVLATTLKWEGGWANHPKDPGGATMKGVIQRTYDAYRLARGLPRRSVREIQDNELQDIYRTGYWIKVNGDNLRVGEDLAVFDFGVNSGPARAAKYFQRAVGAPQDGQIGSATLRAAAKLTPAETVKRVCDARLGFVRALSTWSTFGKGWARRIGDIRARGIAWAAGSTQVAKDDAKAIVEEAKKDTANAQKTGSGGAVTGGGTVAADQAQGLDWSAIIGLGIVALILIAIAFLFWSRARARKDMAAGALEAIKDMAKEKFA